MRAGLQLLPALLPPAPLPKPRCSAPLRRLPWEEDAVARAPRCLSPRHDPPMEKLKKSDRERASCLREVLAKSSLR